MGWQDAQQERRGTFQKEVDKEYEGWKVKKAVLAWPSWHFQQQH